MKPGDLVRVKSHLSSNVYMQSIAGWEGLITYVDEFDRCSVLIRSKIWTVWACDLEEMCKSVI